MSDNGDMGDSGSFGQRRSISPESETRQSRPRSLSSRRSRSVSRSRSSSARRSRSRSSSIARHDDAASHRSSRHQEKHTEVKHSSPKHGDDNHNNEKHQSSATHHAAPPGYDEPPALIHSAPPKKKAFLPRLAIPVALLVGAGIIGGTTYALVARVQHLIATAAVDGDPNRWKAAARTQAYDACYLGCNDCSDPSFAFNACQVTASVQSQVTGRVICDGNKMWNWAAADRYPDQCLDAIGKILMGTALDSLKKSYRNQLAIIVLTVLGGVVGGIITYFLWRRFTVSKEDREAAKHKRKVTWRPSTWRQQKPSTSNETTPSDITTVEAQTPNLKPAHRTSTSSISSHSRTRPSSPKTQNRFKVFYLAFLGLFSAKTASAYSCIGHGNPSYDQHFISTNRTAAAGVITGVVHGWLSNCYDRQDCTKTCSNSCSTDSSGKKTCKDSCSNKCVTRSYADRRPQQYVEDVLPRVRACGFETVAGTTGSTTTRLANANLERTLWVRIEVSGLNVTRKDETDEAVECLHALV
ncbi:hypothetical protein B0T17DRAFT_620163 [Bombardia bombarda]|uniref:Uncharacterized protein n=1 Tax=Bombardia bombarda TaxID=252184 RepID=A0AA39WHD9_9PEZI|nr:hypothetical protein B0T17DRAFT_620163 [Bombardia bombarda]